MCGSVQQDYPRLHIQVPWEHAASTALPPPIESTDVVLRLTVETYACESLPAYLSTTGRSSWRKSPRTETTSMTFVMLNFGVESGYRTSRQSMRKLAQGVQAPQLRLAVALCRSRDSIICEPSENNGKYCQCGSDLSRSSKPRHRDLARVTYSPHYTVTHASTPCIVAFPAQRIYG